MLTRPTMTAGAALLAAATAVGLLTTSSDPDVDGRSVFASLSDGDAIAPGAPDAGSEGGGGEGEGEVEQLPTPMEVAVVLHRCGYGPEALAAAGVQQQMLNGLILGVRNELFLIQDELETADAAFAEARRGIQQLRRLIRSGQGTEGDVAELQNLIAAQDQLDASRQALIASLIAAGAESVGAPVQTALSTIDRNAHWKLPTPYLVVDREERDWVALRTWLAIERIAGKEGEAVPQETAASLEAARSVAAVAQALSEFSERGSAIETAWDTIVGLD